MSFGLVRAGLEGGLIVREHQCVLVFSLFEEIENAFVLEQPRDKVEVGLTVLHTILARLIGALEFELVIGEAPVREDLFDDVGHRFVLEDTAVGIEGEEPKPWHHLGLVGGHAVVAVLHERNAVDEPVNVPFGVVV